MSAIVGIYNLDGRPVAPADLGRMVESMAFRGPDGSAIWHEGAVGLGHLMLHTTPESLHETLPLVDKTRDLALTADARIDNREDLSEALGLSVEQSRAMSDSEFILAAYVKWGEECPKHLLGDFAFVIWDGRAQKLFCARDHFGVKPFYYYHAPGKFFAFATQIRGLLALENVPRRLNELRVGVYLTEITVSASDTFFEDILRLPARNTLTLVNKTPRFNNYWAFDVPPELKLKSDEDYAHAFYEQFEQAVKCRLRSAFPVGSALSGGLDSSAIVCTARKILRREKRPDLHTFSAIFPGLPDAHRFKSDEREFIGAVEAGGCLIPHHVQTDLSSPFTDVDRVLDHMDEVSWNPNLYIHWGLYQEAQSHGVRTFMDGVDGDTTVSHGFGYFRELVCRGQLRKLAQEARAFSNRNSGHWTFRSTLWNLGISPCLSHFRSVRSAVERDSTYQSRIINADFSCRIGLPDYLEANLPRQKVPLSAREEHRDELLSLLFPHAFEIIDKMTAPFSMETRFPFADVELAKFCVSLPTSQKLHDGWTRVVMRRAMESVLPPEVQWRTGKADLSPNFELNLLKIDQTFLKTAVKDSTQAISEFVDVASVGALYDAFAQDAVHKGDAISLYAVANLNAWLSRTKF